MNHKNKYIKKAKQKSQEQDIVQKGVICDEFILRYYKKSKKGKLIIKSVSQTTYYSRCQH